MARSRFDQARAQRVERFFERALVHTKGRWARTPFVLRPWQRDEIIYPLFGTVHFDHQLKTWVRAYVLAWLELARKNGKSELLAGMALYLLMADGEEEAEVYGVAKDRDQAGVVFQVAKRMVELSPALGKLVASKKLEVIDSKRRIVFRPTGSYYEVLAADAGGNLGKNPHGIVFDEVITQPSRELWDELKTGMGTRDQPLMAAATTAGNDPTSMAAEEHLHSEAVVTDPSIDPARFVFMRNTPTDADWRDERVWPLANPALGDFLRIQVLRDEAKEAERSPAKQNAFRQFRLNQWVRQTTRWLDMGLWDANAGLVVADQLKGRDCYGGLDLASTADFTAWVLFFPGEGEDHVLARFWLPEAAVERRSPMRPLLEAWVKGGFLTVTSGDVVNYDAIRAQIDADAQDFRIRRVGYDRWNANEVVTWMRNHGLVANGVAQTTTELNRPSKELERLLGRRRLRHGANPVLRWMADNVQATIDHSGNIKPDRAKSKEKIDGIAALVDAVHQHLAVEAEGKPFAFVLSS